MSDEYVGLVKAPDFWWMCRDRRVFDAFDWPGGFERDTILSRAMDDGVLIQLGPATMDSAHAAAAARRVLGEEVTPEHGLDGFTPNTQRGRDFVAGTGEFAQDETKEER